MPNKIYRTSKRTKRANEKQLDKMLSRRNLIITIIIGITVIASFFLELPQKINESLKVFSATPLAFTPADKSQTLIIITDFENRSGGNSFGVDPAQYIYEGIKKQITKSNLPIRVERLYQTVNDHTAKPIGQKYKASLVLWGWYDALTITPRLERIRNNKEEFDFKDYEEDLRFDISNLENIKFTVITDLPRYSSYVVLFTLALDRFGVGEYVDALSLVNSALAVIPKDEKTLYNTSEAYYLRGGIDYLQKDYQQAVIDFGKFIENNPMIEYGLVARGGSYAKLQNYDAAISDFNKALEVNSDFESAYYNRGVYYFSQHENNKAILDLSKAIELDPNNLLSYLSRGTAYQASKNNQSALADYRKILEINPNFVPAYVNIGTLYSESGNYDLAFVEFEKAIRLAPNFEGIYYNRGLAYYHKGDNELALADCNKAIELNPEFSDAYFNRGVVYIALRQKEKAIADFYKVLDISQDVGMRQQAENALLKLGVK